MRYSRVTQTKWPPANPARFTPRNAAKLAQALDSFFDSAASKAAVACTVVRAKYGLEAMVDAQVALYQRLTRHLSQLEALPDLTLPKEMSDNKRAPHS
jgi:hypothetical protein